MSKLLLVKFFYIFGFVATSVFANSMPAEGNVSTTVTSQWKGGKVTARDANNAIIDVYPGYLNIAAGRNCILARENDISKADLNECTTPGYTPFNATKEMYLTIEVVPGSPGLCLAAQSNEVILEPCVANKETQSWRLLNHETRPNRGGVPVCLTANGLGNEVKLTACQGFAEQRWGLP